MARKPRIDLPGYHHIVNRGVNKLKGQVLNPKYAILLNLNLNLNLRSISWQENQG